MTDEDTPWYQTKVARYTAPRGDAKELIEEYEDATLDRRGSQILLWVCDHR